MRTRSGLLLRRPRAPRAPPSSRAELGFGTPISAALASTASSISETPTTAALGIETPTSAAFSITPGARSRARGPDLFDLPRDVLQQIFAADAPLLLAETVCRRWRRALRSNPTYWVDACARIGASPPSAVGVLDGAPGGLSNGAPAGVAAGISSMAPEVLALRRAYVEARGTKCRHCKRELRYHLRSKGFDDASSRLCRGCRRLEPHAVVTLDQARRYFALGRRALPPGTAMSPRAKGNTKLYSFSALSNVAISKYGVRKARMRIERARRELGISLLPRTGTRASTTTTTTTTNTNTPTASSG